MARLTKPKNRNPPNAILRFVGELQRRSTMLCGPIAVESATGIDRWSVVLRIRAAREARGRQISLRGGTDRDELKAAAHELGWRMRQVFQNRRVRLGYLAKRIKKGRWIFRQRGHFFGVASGRDLRILASGAPNANLITHAWRLTPLRHQ